MKNETAMKLIVKDAIKQELVKRRDMTSNGSPVYGDYSEQAKAVLLVVEDQIDKNFQRLEKGESIYDIVPGLEHETKYDQ